MFEIFYGINVCLKFDNVIISIEVFLLAHASANAGLQNSIPLSSLNSSADTGNLNGSLSNGRQSWMTTTENVHEHEKSPSISPSIVSSSVINDPIGWHNLTKR